MNLNAQTTTVVTPEEDLIVKVAEAADGDTLVLQAGFYKANYDYIRVISKNLTIKAAAGVGKPKVYFERIQLEDTLDSPATVNLTLESIEFSGFDVDSLTGVENTDLLIADYFINLESSLKQFGDIVVKNCIIRNIIRAGVRGDRSSYSGNGFTFDNCIIYDIRDGEDNNFGVFRFKEGITFTSFMLTNSTIYDVRNRILNCENLDGFHQDILFDNCTFYKITNKKDGHYIFDFKTNTDVTFTMKDCIFSKTISEGLAFNGWRFVDDTPVTTLITSVFAPDFVLSGGTVADINWDAVQSNLEDHDPGFDDPENGDFTLPEDSPLLTASEEGGIIGDPRWNPFAVSAGEVIQDHSFDVYPNPAGSVLHIRVKEQTDVTLYSSIGLRMREYRLHEGLNTLAVEDLTPGLYFIKAGAGDEMIKKVIIK